MSHRLQQPLPTPPDLSLGHRPALTLARSKLAEMVAHCLSCYPEEGCGLLSGHADTGELTKVHPTRNLSSSARVYTVDPAEHLRADREAEVAGTSIIGVFHSHTHTDPYPSPTDAAQALDASWYYVIVSLRHELASTRSYRIEAGNIYEEPIVVLRG